MAGDILIIDGTATNRIVLKVKLLAAQYRVRPCATLPEAITEIAASLPDLILLDTGLGTDAVQTLCQHLKSRSATSVIPVIATGGFSSPDARLAALEAGADDVLSKPFDDHILQARIRSLLRARDARQELRMREGTRTALGFAEAQGTFTAPAKVLVAYPSEDAVIDPEDFGEGLANTQTITALTGDIVGGQDEPSAVDLYVLDFRTGLRNDKALFRLLSELRSRSSSRHASILAWLPEHARECAAMALDLGASDIVCGDVTKQEIRHRAAVLLRAKQEADDLRKTVETGLEAAITDPLTGLFNRRYAIPHLNRLTEESRTTGRRFAVMVLDLDHFKAINDRHGHAIGDEVLKQVAHRLKDNLRAVDLLARLGGEEFLVAIPNSDPVHARTAAERLRNLIGSSPFYVGADRRAVHVTTSVGVSLNGGSEAGETIDDLGAIVGAADVALYAAKSGGRNQVSLSAA